MALVVGSSLRHAVYTEAVGIEAYEVHLARDRLQELLLALSLLDSVVQSVLMFVNLHDDPCVSVSRTTCTSGCIWPQSRCARQL